MPRSTTFTRGSGAYKCRSCGRLTRDDGNGDSVMVMNCTQCFELAGYDNMVNDNGGPDCLTEGDKQSIQAMADHIKSKGGNIDGDFDYLRRAGVLK